MKQFLRRLERVFRVVVVYPLFRLLFRSRAVNSTVDISKVRRLLILRHDRIGDMIVTTPILRNLKQLQPKLHLGVFASPGNAEIIRHDSNVDAIYVLYRNVFRLFREIRKARRDNYDIVLSFVFNRTTSVALLARLVGPRALRIGHADEKYQFYFDRLVKLPRFSVHMVESLAVYIKAVFGIELRGEDLRYEIQIDASTADVVNRFLAKYHLRRRSARPDDLLPYVVLNLSATDAERRISVAQAKAVAGYLTTNPSFQVLVIHAPNDRQMDRAVRSEEDFAECVRYPEEGQAALLEIASLIQGALCVITPDTAIVHFASAAQTPVLVFFTTAQGMQEWLPYGIPHCLVTAEPGESVSSIGNARVIDSVDRFLRQLALQTC